jgi:hypothetical protein
MPFVVVEYVPPVAVVELTTIVDDGSEYPTAPGLPWPTVPIPLPLDEAGVIDPEL